MKNKKWHKTPQSHLWGNVEFVAINPELYGYKYFFEKKFVLVKK